MNTYHNHTTPHISHVTLRVTSLENSTRFYQNLLGLKIRNQNEELVSLGNDFESVLTLKKATKPHRFTEGLYHIAFLLPTLKDLAQWFLYQQKRNLIIYGASDHIVSKAFYLNDPDGNGIEIYADTDPSAWTESRNGIHMDTLPLNIEELISGVKAPETLAGNIQIGHLHLKAKDVRLMKNFYRLLNFDVRLNMGHAIFMSFHQYHHHLAVNQWNHTQMSNHHNDDVDINDYTIQYPSQEELDKIVNRLTENHITVFRDNDEISVNDPLNIKIHLTKYQLEQ